jgi:tRNA(Met) C34 N-acetyltransferase TmcA
MTCASALARKVMEFRPDEKQLEVLLSRSRRLLLNCSRQWGKSTTAAWKAAHRAVYQARALVVLVSPTERQTGELFRKTGEALAAMGFERKGDGTHGLSWVLPNGSRILGVPGTEATVRGYSAANLVIVDEAARVEDELYRSLRPMLAVSNGDLILLSTPFGERGFFWREWAEGV